MSVNVAEVFGQDVFNEAVMKERLPEVTYKQMVKLMEEGGDVWACGHCGKSHEGMGNREGCYPLYPYFPALHCQHRR